MVSDGLLRYLAMCPAALAAGAILDRMFYHLEIKTMDLIQKRPVLLEWVLAITEAQTLGTSKEEHAKFMARLVSRFHKSVKK